MTVESSPRKSQSKPLLWIALGCAVLLVGALAFTGAIVAIVFGALRSSSPYREAVARARADQRVVAALGTPIEPGWFVSGHVNTEGRSGRANLAIPLSGPKQKATLDVVAYRSRGVWHFTDLTVTPKEGKPIELLTSSEVPVGTAPPDE